MTRIGDLIEKHAPHGVEYKAIGEVATCISGATPAKGVARYWEGGTIPWMSSGEVNKGTVHETEKRITQAGYDSCSTKMLPANVVVMALAGQGKTRGLVARTRTELCTNQSLAAIIPNSELDTDFLWHYLQTQYQKLRDISSGDGTRGGLNLQMIRAYRVPVPALDVQREIVGILDGFTELEAGLEAELEAELEVRRQQYAHYRTSLFSFAGRERIRWVTLNDICTRVSSGGTPASGQAEYFGGAIPWLRTQEVDYVPIHATGMTITEKGLQNSSAKWIPANCVIVAMYGATAAKVATNAIPLTTNQACCNLEVDPEEAEYRYVFHWIANEYEPLRSLGEGSQSNLNAQKIKSYPIPVPPLAEQRRIVAILDQLDALVNDLSSGLSAEIAARREQYAYYRERLLTFEEVAA